MINIKLLSPDQKDALLQSLLGAAGGSDNENVGGNGMSDMNQDQNLIQEYMELLANGMEILASKIQSLEKAVYEDLVGGLTSVLSARTRASILEEAHTKYPQFGEFGDSIKEIDGSDLWEEFADILSEMRDEPDYDEASEGDRVNQLYETMKSKMGRIRGTPDELALESPVEEKLAIEEAPIAEVPVRGMPDIENIKRTAARLKAANITSV